MFKDLFKNKKLESLKRDIDELHKSILNISMDVDMLVAQLDKVEKDTQNIKKDLK